MSKTTTVSARPSKEALIAVQDTAKKYELRALNAFGHLERAIMLAEGIELLRTAITPLLPNLIGLMNTPLGFDTDRNPTKPKKDGSRPEPYPMETIRDCIVEALLRGLNVAGNEFNIIAHRCYSTKNGYARLVKEMEGITDLDWGQSPPFQQAGSTCVKCRAQWKLNGIDMELKDSSGRPGAIYAIKQDGGTGIDALLAKAERRMWKAIYGICTGMVFTEPNIDEAPPDPVPAIADATKTTAEKVIEHAKTMLPAALTNAADVKIYPKSEPPVGPVTADQLGRLNMGRHVISDDEFWYILEKDYSVMQLEQLTAEQAEKLLSRLKEIKVAQGGA